MLEARLLLHSLISAALGIPGGPLSVAGDRPMRVAFGLASLVALGLAHAFACVGAAAWIYAVSALAPGRLQACREVLRHRAVRACVLGAINWVLGVALAGLLARNHFPGLAFLVMALLFGAALTGIGGMVLAAGERACAHAGIDPHAIPAAGGVASPALRRGLLIVLLPTFVPFAGALLVVMNLCVGLGAFVLSRGGSQPARHPSPAAADSTGPPLP